MLIAALTASIACRRETEAPVLTSQGPRPVPAIASDLRSVGERRAGTPSSFVLTLRDAGGSAVELDDVGGEAVHVIAVRKNLSWIRHAHPQATSSGTFAFDITFPHDGSYTVFALLVPAGRERQIVRRDIVVGMPDGEEAPQLTVSPRKRRFGRYDVRLTTEPPLAVAGRWATLTFHLERNGVPLTDLRAEAGSGHLVIVDATGANLVYAHSTDGEALRGVRAKAHLPAAPSSIKPHEHLGDDRGPEVRFHAFFPAPGRYKVWAEFAPGEDHLTTDFVIEVPQRQGVSP